MIATRPGSSESKKRLLQPSHLITSYLNRFTVLICRMIHIFEYVISYRVIIMFISEIKNAHKGFRMIVLVSKLRTSARQCLKIPPLLQALIELSRAGSEVHSVAGDYRIVPPFISKAAMHSNL